MDPRLVKDLEFLAEQDPVAFFFETTLPAVLAAREPTLLTAVVQLVGGTTYRVDGATRSVQAVRPGDHDGPADLRLVQSTEDFARMLQSNAVPTSGLVAGTRRALLELIGLLP
jgi:hypothetical protein